MSPWAWHAHPTTWLLTAVVVVLYAVALRRRPAGAVVRPSNIAAFVAGVLALEVAADWPLHDLAERYLFSAHMLQHTLLSLVAPPLFLLALPPWLLERLTSPAWLQAVLRKTARPIPATLGFNGFIAISHWPKWIDFTLYHHGWHFWAHAGLVILAFNMWFPVVNTLPGLPRLSPPGKMLYLFLQSIVPTVPASFLAFAEAPMFHFYEHVPRVWLSVVEDQQLAGAIMKVGGSGILWSLIVVIFFRWYSRSEKGGGDVLTWEDVERQFDRAGPPPRDRVSS